MKEKKDKRTEAYHKIFEARLQLLTYEPLFAQILYDHKIEVSDFPYVKTAKIDLENKVVYFNESFANALYKVDPFLNIPDYRMINFVLSHEVCHYLLLAKERETLGNKDSELWSLAQDYVINLWLKDIDPNEIYLKMPEKIYWNPETKRWTTEPCEGCIEINPPYYEGFRGKTSEEIYYYLVRNSKKRKIKTKINGIEVEVTVYDVHLPDCTTVTTKPIDIAIGLPETDKDISDIIETVMKAWSITGSGNPVLREIIESILYPEIDWRIVLDRYVRYAISGYQDYKWLPPNPKKLAALKIYLPSTYEKTIRAVVAVDSSGSITDEEFEWFVSEVQGILSTYEKFEILVLVCDHEVVGEQLIRFRGESVDRSIWKGRRGTDFRPVFKRVEELMFYPDVLIYFTDMEVGKEAFPEVKPPYPVIWVITQPKEKVKIKPPFGEIIWYKRRKGF